MTVTRLIARPMLASIFVVGGITALRNAPALATKAQPVTDKLVPQLKKAMPGLPIPEDPTTLVRLHAAAQLAAGGALATGRAPRISAAVLAASLLPKTVVGHRFWRAKNPQTRSQQQLRFFQDVSLLGGLLIAAGDTDGKPGMVWRARRVAKDARREAKHLTHAARREAKLAKAQLT